MMSEPTSMEYEQMITALTASKDIAYAERNRFLKLFSIMAEEAHLARHPDSDTAWEDDWRNIVCVHTKQGQMSFHIHDSELANFSHLKMQANDWDGHTTEEKWKRFEQLCVVEHAIVTGAYL